MKTWNWSDWKEDGGFFGNVGPGEWDKEPDKAQWEHEGFDCLIVRGPLGALCGYVGIPKDHKLYGCDYPWVNEFYDISVHGGLTFANECQPGEMERAICHKDGVNDDVWWLGFDCCHYRDFIPHHKRERFGGVKKVYRNFEYVKKQTESLARQLKEI